MLLPTPKYRMEPVSILNSPASAFGDGESPLEPLARRELYGIVATLVPDALISHRCTPLEQRQSATGKSANFQWPKRLI